MHVIPVHAPPNPENENPEAAVAESVTVVPGLNAALQEVGQLIPAGLLVTVPLPATVTVNWAWEGGGGGELVPPPPPQLERKPARSSTHTRSRTGISAVLHRFSCWRE